MRAQPREVFPAFSQWLALRHSLVEHGGMVTDSAREQFLAHLRNAAEQGLLVKLTLGHPDRVEPELRNLFVRPVQLNKGPHLCFLWRYQTRDITKNLLPEQALIELTQLIGSKFLDAHLFTSNQVFELRCMPKGHDKLVIRKNSEQAPKAPPAGNNREKNHLISADAPWLQALGVTNERGDPRADMSGKLRQIQKFAELLQHLITEAGILPQNGAAPLSVYDMGCGKGYLTFSVASLLGDKAQVTGVELRQELADKVNAIASSCGIKNLRFIAGTIGDAPMEKADLVIALHACDTATDDAIARGIQAGARLLVLAPCCQKELRPQLQAPDILADALRHGIFQERQAEFITDALRAELLEWAGYRTRVFEFIATEHTAKNIMIAAVRVRDHHDEARAPRIRELAAFYGIRHHHLATLLGFSLAG